MIRPTTNNEMPWAECPHCGAMLQLETETWCSWRGGESFECNCGKTVHVLNVDVAMYVELGTVAVQ